MKCECAVSGPCATRCEDRAIPLPIPWVDWIDGGGGNGQDPSPGDNESGPSRNTGGHQLRSRGPLPSSSAPEKVGGRGRGSSGHNQATVKAVQVVIPVADASFVPMVQSPVHRDLERCSFQRTHSQILMHSKH